VNNEEHAARFVSEVLRAYACGTDVPEWPPDVAPAALHSVVRRNRAQPLLGCLLAAREPGARWGAIRQEWIAAYKRWLLHGMRGLEAGQRVWHELEEAGVPAIPMRGPFFGSTLYGDVGIRSFTDLDILVPRGAAESAWRVVTRLGYRLSNPVLTRGMYLRHHLAWPLRNERGVSLDLHWALDHPYTCYAVRYDEIFAASRVIRHPDGPWREPDPGHLVLVNCLHLAKERGAVGKRRPDMQDAILRGELTVCLDVALAVKAAEAGIAWARRIEEARQWNTEEPLRMGLDITRGLGMNGPDALPALPVAATRRDPPSWLQAVARRRCVQRLCTACAFRPERVLDAYEALVRPRGRSVRDRLRLGVRTAVAAVDAVRCLHRMHRIRRST